MTAPRIDVSELRLANPGGRRLFDALRLRVTNEHIALVGRNGVGKSTLLRALAGELEPERGTVRSSGTLVYVPQLLARAHVELSHGEQRRQQLEQAFAARPQILLLDEPSEDLDEQGVDWLRGAIRQRRGCLIVASHDRRLLGDFEDFLVASDTGCRYFSGGLNDLEASLEQERLAAELRYASQLTLLAEAERRTLQIEQRKARKKRYGRLSELDRATPKIRLNQKRGDAQVSHGRLARQREQRLNALRGVTRAMRGSITVRLSTELLVPELPEAPRVVLWLREAAWELELGRARVGVVGANGAGKTTLLEAALGERAWPYGHAWCDRAKIGSIAQGAADWCRDESLLELLVGRAGELSPAQAVGALSAHKFPLRLAERPLVSLSPGERTRAALIALFQRRPTIELLVLDEPTFSLDLLGQRALHEALCAWQGGLLVASHDRDFLAAIGVTRLLELPLTGSRAAQR